MNSKDQKSIWQRLKPIWKYVLIAFIAYVAYVNYTDYKQREQKKAQQLEEAKRINKEMRDAKTGWKAPWEY